MEQKLATKESLNWLATSAIMLTVTAVFIFLKVNKIEKRVEKLEQK